MSVLNRVFCGTATGIALTLTLGCTTYEPSPLDVTSADKVFRGTKGACFRVDSTAAGGRVYVNQCDEVVSTSQCDIIGTFGFGTAYPRCYRAQDIPAGGQVRVSKDFAVACAAGRMTSRENRHFVESYCIDGGNTPRTQPEDGANPAVIAGLSALVGAAAAYGEARSGASTTHSPANSAIASTQSPPATTGASRAPTAPTSAGRRTNEVASVAERDAPTPGLSASHCVRDDSSSQQGIVLRNSCAQRIYMSICIIGHEMSSAACDSVPRGVSATLSSYGKLNFSIAPGGSYTVPFSGRATGWRGMACTSPSSGREPLVFLTSINPVTGQCR